MLDGKIILVDDNEAVLKTLKVILAREFKTVVGVSVPTLLPALLRENDVDIVLLDMNFGIGRQDGSEGLFWLERIVDRPDPPQVVLVTAFGDIELAVSALKKGAADFVVKPWDNDQLVAVLQEAFRRRRKGQAVLPTGSPSPGADDPYIGKTASASRPVTLEEMEKQFIREVLRENNGNLTLCAQRLDISRQTLYNKMRKYGL
ncbi:response regulator [uncultured Parabacteroides sp.]|uniref:response regulator n=1 Tax=uncultured Parabacteroides sp. TaxID=512312 RepID=UPI00263974EF|nr:response regulator [uncultured Parabacteroides sp.]